MNYHVRWKRSARDQLRCFWINAADRQAVTNAANAIDSELQRDPLNAGESRAGSRRILIVAPLVVVYRVDAQQRRVVVLSVRSLPSHP